MKDETLNELFDLRQKELSDQPVNDERYLGLVKICRDNNWVIPFGIEI